LQTISNVHLLAKDQGKAEAAVCELRSLFQKAGDVDGEVSALQALSDLHLGSKKREMAIQALEEMRELCQKSGDCKLEAAALHALSDLRVSMDEPEEAARAAYEAGVLQKKVGDARGEAHALLKAARLQAAKAVEGDGATEGVVRTSMEALALFERVGDQRGTVDALHTAAAAHFAAGAPEEAVAACDRSLAHLDLLGDRAAKAEIFHWAADMLAEKGSPDLSIAAAEKAVALHREAESRPGRLGLALLTLAKARQSASSAGAEGDVKGAASTQEARGRTRQVLEAATESAALLARAAPEEIDPALCGEAFQLTAQAHLLEGDSGGALCAARLAAAAHSAAQNSLGMGRALLLLGRAHLLRRQRVDARWAAQGALESFRWCRGDSSAEDVKQAKELLAAC